MRALSSCDYENTPEGPPWFQLVEGRLLQEPSPLREHQDICRELAYAFSSYLKEHPVGLMFFAPFDVYFDEWNVLQPDLLFVREERASIVTQRGVRGAPDLIVEILSPSNRRLDLVTKKRIYARFGVRELWIIDPKARSATLCDLIAGNATTAQTLGSRQLPGLMIPLGTLFPSPRR